MVKIYKQNNKLIAYLPFEVTTALALKEGDEVDFFKFNDKSFIFAKKEDITNMIMKSWGGGAQQQQQNKNETELSQDEINVLKKLDTIRYSERNRDSVSKMLNEKESALLKQLVAKKAVNLFSKDKGASPVYSISREVYNKYLLRKKELVKTEAVKQEKAFSNTESYLQRSNGIENESVKVLEEKGFVVLPTEAEAASLSVAVEDSIRSGIVIGTRSFNKKYYIMMRSFFENYAPKVIKTLAAGKKTVDEIAKEIGIEEEAARGILNLLAENGDVSEKRRDLFELA